MTDADLEILIYAGIAAGLKFVRPSDDKTALLMEGVEKPWNPLADDGDALRLAVHMGLSIQVHHDSSQPFPWLRVVDHEQRWTHEMVKEYGADPAAATRRAITRAAAEIGKQMGGGNV